MRSVARAFAQSKDPYHPMTSRTPFREFSLHSHSENTRRNRSASGPPHSRQRFHINRHKSRRKFHNSLKSALSDSASLRASPKKGGGHHDHSSTVHTSLAADCRRSFQRTEFCEARSIGGRTESRHGGARRRRITREPRTAGRASNYLHLIRDSAFKDSKRAVSSTRPVGWISAHRNCLSMRFRLLVL